MYLANDSRHSDYTGAVVDGDISYAEAKQKVAEEACDADLPVSLILVHSASMANEALEAGCASLVVGGHLHKYVPPKPVVGENGNIGYKVTTNTAGGAPFSFSYGLDLRRPAGDTLIKFSTSEAGKLEPVAVQPITYTPDGKIIAGEITPLIYDDNVSQMAELPPDIQQQVKLAIKKSRTLINTATKPQIKINANLVKVK